MKFCGETGTFFSCLINMTINVCVYGSGSGIDGSALAMFNDQMTTANAQMRIGSPTNPLYNRSTASSSSISTSANQISATSSGRGDPSSLSSSNSSTNLMSHFGSSAIRFRSSGDAPSATTTTTTANNFKDERLVVNHQTNLLFDGWDFVVVLFSTTAHRSIISQVGLPKGGSYIPVDMPRSTVLSSSASSFLAGQKKKSSVLIFHPLAVVALLRLSSPAGAE